MHKCFMYNGLTEHALFSHVSIDKSKWTGRPRIRADPLYGTRRGGLLWLLASYARPGTRIPDMRLHSTSLTMKPLRTVERQQVSYVVLRLVEVSTVTLPVSGKGIHRQAGRIKARS